MRVCLFVCLLLSLHQDTSREKRQSNRLLLQTAHIFKKNVIDLRFSQGCTVLETSEIFFKVTLSRQSLNGVRLGALASTST